MMPMYFLPYIFFSPHTPYASATLCSVSASSGKPSPYLSSNFFCFAGLSGLMPMHGGVADRRRGCRAARTPASCSRACRPSGRSTRAPCGPCSADSFTVSSSWSSSEIAGALSPVLSSAMTATIRQPVCAKVGRCESSSATSSASTASCRPRRRRGGHRRRLPARRLVDAVLRPDVMGSSIGEVIERTERCCTGAAPGR